MVDAGGFPLASADRLAVPASLSTLGIRFTASGSDNDDWKAKSVVARLQAVPAGPSLLDVNPAVTPAPVCKGSVVSVSLPFNEIVTVTGTPTLSTTWGTLSYVAGSGANVLTFAGTVTAAAGRFGVIEVLSGGNLILTNSVPGSGAITGGKAAYGGGVYVDWDGTFTMAGGAISGNTADYGGGVYVNSSRFTVSGSPVVSGSTNSVGAANNVYLDSGRTIAVNGLSPGARIGVTTATAPTASAPVTFATGAAEGEERYFVSDDSGYHVERDGNTLRLVEGAISPSFTDPEGVKIEDQALVEWLSANNFTQTDINNLGNDAAATDKLYECYLLNCDLTAANPGGALRITGFAVSNGVVSVTVQLVRQSPLGIINGVLYLYGATDLAAGFGRSPIAAESIDFGTGDSTFATNPAAGTVTQSVTATFSVDTVAETFFNAAIKPYKYNEPEPDVGEQLP